MSLSGSLSIAHGVSLSQASLACEYRWEIIPTLNPDSPELGTPLLALCSLSQVFEGAPGEAPT